MTRREQAIANFKEGYNCAQAVALAFADKMDMDTDTLLRLSSSFGGGMGRLREVCGAVSAMFIVAGVVKGYSDPKAPEEKKQHYALIQLLAEKFKEKNGTIVCRELLGGNPSTAPTPEARTDAYYKKRPCVEMVGDAAEIVGQVLFGEED